MHFPLPGPVSCSNRDQTTHWTGQLFRCFSLSRYSWGKNIFTDWGGNLKLPFKRRAAHNLLLRSCERSRWFQHRAELKAACTAVWRWTFKESHRRTDGAESSSQANIALDFQQKKKKKRKLRAEHLSWAVLNRERTAWLKPQLIKTTRCVNSEAAWVDAQCIMNLTLHSHHSEPSQAAGHADLRIALHLLTTSIDLMDPNGLTWRGMASQPCNVYHLEVCCFYHLAEFMPLRWLKISK